MSFGKDLIDFETKMNEKVKKMNVWHMALLKLSVFFFTLFLIKICPFFLRISWYWSLFFSLVIAIPIYKIFYPEVFNFMDKNDDKKKD
jgi:hypothetical protein